MIEGQAVSVVVVYQVLQYLGNVCYESRFLVRRHRGDHRLDHVLLDCLLFISRVLIQQVFVVQDQIITLLNVRDQ